MTNGRETHQHGYQIGTDLEPYRRLIETQRALIEMARKHEETRRQCDALREVMSRQMFRRPSALQLMLHKIQRAMSRVTRRFRHAVAAEPAFEGLDNKQPSSC